MQKFHGAWPALITPSSETEAVDINVLQELTAYLLEKDIGGLYLCGSTGEGLFMSVEERKLTLEVVMDQVKDRVPVIVHVGSVATRDAVTLAEHAQAMGAEGISSLLPTVAWQEESTYLHYEAIAAAAPDLPFFAYLFGGQTDAVALMQELLMRIPNIAGAKYTGGDMYEFSHIVELGNTAAANATQWTVFSGRDQDCLYAAMVGAPANIGTTLNVMPGIYREIRKLYEAGDLPQAQVLQTRANRVTRVLQDFGLFGALREAMRLLGFDCGKPRLPTPPFPADKRKAFHKALDTVDFNAITAM
jgi:N-acetylneuraminate lyase